MARALVLLLASISLVGFIAACGGDGEEELAPSSTTIGNITYSDHGVTEISKGGEVRLEADNFYFEPTFLRGRPGQKVKVKIENESSTVHNFSISAQQIDEDVPAGGGAEIEVTVPESGALLFVCKYHTAQGMNGQILAGSSQPQTAGSPSSAPVNPIGGY